MILTEKIIEEYSYFNCNITNCRVRRGSRCGELCYSLLQFLLIIFSVSEVKRVIN